MRVKSAGTINENFVGCGVSARSGRPNRPPYPFKMNLTRALPTLPSAGLFVLAYAQAPLYYSNQNQYFLHGIAAADDGPLRDDWLANTASPTPAFDALVRVTAELGGERATHLYYALLLGIYWISLVGLSDFLMGERATPGRRLAFAALLALVHSALLRWASYRWLGADYPCYAQGWLAAQYVLGAVLQPSAFGVFLLAGIDQFVRGRPILAATCTAIACIGHSTYLLPGGMLTLAFAGVLIWEGKSRTALMSSAWTLLLVLPGMVHAYLNFRPTSPEAFAEACRILAEVRIPHHCDPHRWFDAIAALQVAWIALSVVLVRRTRLFPILAALALASLALTLFQLLTGSHTLALLFPWRSSVILLPLATAIVLTRSVALAGPWIESLLAMGLSIGAPVILAAGGVVIMATHRGYARVEAEEPLLAYVRANRHDGDVYLLPVSVPKWSGARGAMSSDFKPLPAQRRDGDVIPVDFQRFRLVARTPIHVDFKAIPYRDADVLEWHRRVEWNEGLYADRDWNRTGALAEVKAAGITHIVVTRDRDVISDGLRAVYEDANYRVYAVGR